jgi:hypothetical protein
VQEDNMIDAIQAVLDAPESGDVVALEQTLTAGYAQALSLDAERWRIERRIGEVAATLDDDDATAKTQEIVALAQRLEASGTDLATLRNLLASLRVRADSARATATRATA